MLVALLSAGLAVAAPITPGERLEWSVRWMGIDAGRAWATTAEAAAGLLFEAGCTSSPWLARLYPVDDRLRSEWRPGAGSSRYVTRFREGDFQQDQDMALAADPIVVSRGQRFKDEAGASTWRTWQDTHPAVPRIEDPVSAFYRLREEAGPVGERVRYVVWTGRHAAGVQIHTAAAEPVDGRPTLRVEVLAELKGGDLQPKMTVWLTDDADRIPLVAEVHTRAGAVRATLTSRTVP